MKITIDRLKEIILEEIDKTDQTNENVLGLPPGTPRMAMSSPGTASPVPEEPEEEMKMADLAKLSLLRETIEKQYPDLEVTTYRLSVNKKLIEDCELADGDEVALLPPFAGG